MIDMQAGGGTLRGAIGKTGCPHMGMMFPRDRTRLMP